MDVRLANKDIRSNYGEELLHERGIIDVDHFLNPTIDDLQSWEDLENIDEGVEILLAVLELDHPNIGLLIDADADGFTSSAIIYQYIKHLRPDVDIEYYVHDGKAHGLGDMVDLIIDKPYDLFIIPDAGSNDTDEVSRLRCPVIIIDHHIVDKTEFPVNMVVINNQSSPRYKNKDLSGAGMVFQFCRALDAATGANFAWLLIDLAALGIVSDMMDARSIENQYIWKEGFNHVNNYFFKTLLETRAYSITGSKDATYADLIEKLNPTTAAFYITPLINAMTRVGTVEENQRMFMAFMDGHHMIPSKKRGAKGTLEEVAVECARECTNNKKHQDDYKTNISERLEQRIFKYDLLENQILFIKLDETDIFPSSINGLIATQLADKYKCPTIIARENNNGIIRGSMRGVNNSELSSFKDYLTSTGLFEYVQGHDNAAGISIPASNFDSLIRKSNEELAAYNFSTVCYDVNFARNGNDSDIGDIIFELEKYKDTWSTGNKTPLIYVEKLVVPTSTIRIMGARKDTVKFSKNGISYIKFFAKDLIEDIDWTKESVVFEIIGEMNVNEFNGVLTPQITINEYEVKPDNKFDF